MGGEKDLDVGSNSTKLHNPPSPAWLFEIEWHLSMSKESTFKASTPARAVIEEAFVPRIHVVADDEVNTLVKNLDHESLSDMLNLHSNLGSVIVRDANTMSRTVENFTVEFTPTDVPEYTAAPDDLEGLLADLLQTPSYAGVEGVFEEWLRGVVKPTDTPPFETFNHPVATVLAVSSKTPNPVEKFTQMFQQGYSPDKITPYINNDNLRVFLFVHDEDSPSDKAALEFEQLKRQFGPYCVMLHLGTSQHEVNDNNVAQAATDIVIKSVVPFMEHCIALWNEQVNASRQGLASRLFTVSKRYLNTPVKLNKNILRHSVHSTSKLIIPVQEPVPPPGPTRGNYYTEERYYFYTSSEAQLRKIADFALMLRDYKTAYTILDGLKKDFLSDKAWGYLAAAQEMAAVAYLANNSNTKLTSKVFTNTIEPLLDSAVYSYISRCHLPGRALRAILIITEMIAASDCEPAVANQAVSWLLKADTENLVGAAGTVMIRERVANIFVQQNRMHPSSRLRKAAFWNLFAAQSWRLYADTPVCQAGFQKCVENANKYCYAKLDWAHENGTLLHELEKLTLRTE